MSIIRDIMDLRDSMSDSLNDGSIKVNARDSISKESSVGVLQFPFLASSSLSLEHTTMGSKACERQYSSFIVIMTSMDSVTNEKSIKDYIIKMHQNIDDNAFNVSDFRESVSFGRIDAEDLVYFKEAEDATINILENVQEYGINAEHLKLEEDEYIMDCNDMDEDDDSDEAVAILSEKKKKGGKLLRSKELKSVVVKDTTKDDYTVSINECYSQIFFIKNMETNKIRLVESNLVTPDVFDKEDLFVKKTLSESNKLMEAYVPDLNMDILNKKTTQNNYILVGDKNLANKYNKFGADLLAESDLVGHIDKNGDGDIDMDYINTMPRDLLKDNDVKKANELAPTLLHLKTYFKDDDDALHAVDYMVGVKCVVHKIDSMSMIENLAKGAKRGKIFFNLMKLTTGEISFWKDFVFAVSRIKDDIKTKFKDNPWWNTLIRRKKYAGVLRTLNFNQQLVPNTTIALSMDDVNKLKSEYGIDIMNIKTAKDIITQYFLMGIVVMDASVETAYFLFDSTNNYAEYSFNSLERENSNSSKDIKNIMQVLGRM